MLNLSATCKFNTNNTITNNNERVTTAYSLRLKYIQIYNNLVISNIN